MWLAAAADAVDDDDNDNNGDDDGDVICHDDVMQGCLSVDVNGMLLCVFFFPAWTGFRFCNFRE